MDTVLLSDRESDLIKAAEFIKSGEIVGIPTETVYGLGADASNEEAVARVFQAKGRPADNPLIVHLADFSQAVDYTKSISELAYKLAERFCPGPLTMVLPKNDRIPMITSGGLDTVGIRVPSHPVMHRIIELSGCPIAAPSANTSGYPSPTSASHVMRDMSGKIAAVVDGGSSEFGVESTVISIEGENTVRILRPGCVTKEMLSEICGEVIIDHAILHELEAGQKAASPGMKYKHYSPRADIIMVEGSLSGFTAYVGENYGDGVYSLIFDTDREGFPYRYMTYGKDSSEQAHLLFQRLRELDDIGAEKVYVRAPSPEGVGLAVYNRLIRAAGFEVIRI
ncbi:L-threonylcarbamoyladenylate synthase [Ruminococcus sp.]|uniref:L-threonylcarbamoyladenylate synthase n=1 Tax=Ruminococcus sp. TaxID=41978 RepID=UPI0025F72689|nr:L-threonylcarbamoyladenylate synthase [Ruminococcus sp.]MBQ6033986.1 threonylcarbamoyl-AMP synthase [Ruminococcus sp.]MBQ6251223.1 threonylcarbamoyl-AMP synthase [Ruminococcus sp.]MBR0512156.1 threonylcarbamoyl-AMP synthase [Ruminococcus sp.]